MRVASTFVGGPHPMTPCRRRLRARLPALGNIVLIARVMLYTCTRH